MEKPLQIEKPIVTVIIPSYNHGKYLAKAINSIINQSYSHFEIIVVDDGSTDNTKDVCLQFSNLKYIYQVNAGLSSARNKGIEASSGQFLVFLDADDWLLNNAIQHNLDIITSNPNVAFVSGGHKVYYEPEEQYWLVQKDIKENHYLRLLEGNFIGMHATVMYQSWVFKTFQYDPTIRFCEDYDLYLKVTRNYPVIHHSEVIAVYRKHDNNMSSNYSEMMKYALLVLAAQEKSIKSSEEKKSLLIGKEFWKTYYSQKIFEHLINQLYCEKADYNPIEIKTLKNSNPILYREFRTKHRQHLKEGIIYKVKNIIKKVLPTGIIKLYQKKPDTLPFAGKVNLGNFDRTSPFSTQFGYDRGGPLDRYYIENFLNLNSSQIKGRVLEIGDNDYTLRFGGQKVTRSDILNIDDTNKQTTFVGDLSNAPHIPSNTFDCIVLTQTLHLIYDFKGAIETCYRLLKPGGRLLLTVPGISHIAHDQWGKYWLWSFTDASMQLIMEERFTKNNISVNTYGNVLVASAFLYGMGLPEIKQEQMDVNDPHYQVIVSVCAVK